MKRFLTRYRGALRFTLALLPLAAAAGYLMLRYLMALYDEDTMAAMVAQLGSTTALLAIGTVQTVIYVAVASFFGYILAEKLGLMRPLRLEKRPLLRTLAVSIPLGVLFSLDYWTFGAWLPGTAVRDSAAAGLTVWGWSSAALYGGVMEELLMRLFLMSLLALTALARAASKVSLLKKSTGMWSPPLAPMGSRPWNLPSLSWNPRQQILGGPSK